jgi:protocatechuate 3,4-dioxygenase beta subunit
MARRAPKKPLIILPEITTGLAYGRGPIGELDNDLTRQHEGEPDAMAEIRQADRAGL